MLAKAFRSVNPGFSFISMVLGAVGPTNVDGWMLVSKEEVPQQHGEEKW